MCNSIGKIPVSTVTIDDRIIFLEKARWGTLEKAPMKYYKIQSRAEKLIYLKNEYFGKNVIDMPYECAGERAFRDFQRTVKYNKPIKAGEFDPQESDERKQLKKEICLFIKEQLKDFVKDNQVISQELFDNVHNKVCNGIISKYGAKAKLSYGQAQKWLNMTMKYLLVLEDENVLRMETYMHVPIDNIIMSLAFSVLDVSKPKLAWSKWNYETYFTYQNTFRSAIRNTGLIPIVWEFRAWKPNR